MDSLSKDYWYLLFKVISVLLRRDACSCSKCFRQSAIDIHTGLNRNKKVVDHLFYRPLTIKLGHHWTSLGAPNYFSHLQDKPSYLLPSLEILWISSLSLSLSTHTHTHTHTHMYVCMSWKTIMPSWKPKAIRRLHICFILDERYPCGDLSKFPTTQYFVQTQ